MILTNEVVKELLLNQFLTKLEDEITTLTRCSVYREYLAENTDSIRKEINTSNIDIHVIEEFMIEKRELLIEFSKRFIEDEKYTTLFMGFSIKYSIYLIYLFCKKEEELLNYIKLRRIPQADSFLKRLKSYIKGLSLDPS